MAMAALTYWRTCAHRLNRGGKVTAMDTIVEYLSDVSFVCPMSFDVLCNVHKWQPSYSVVEIFG
jgi:hypothetical protein